MNHPRVLIIGASVRAATESARRAGWDVVASDMFGDVDLRRIAEFVAIADYPGGFGKVIEDHPLPMIYTGGLENHAALLERPEVLWGNRGESLRKVRDPVWWSSCLSRAGVRVPALGPVANGDSHVTFLSKPLRGAGGGGVTLAAGNTPEAGHYLQERISGEPMGAVFIAADGQAAFCGATRNLVWSGSVQTPFSYGGSVGPMDLCDRVVEQLGNIGNRLAAESRLRGIFGVDFILSEQEGAVPIEVNPRYTASVEVLELAFGISLLESHRHACESNRLDVAPVARSKLVAKTILYAGEPIVVADSFDRQVLPQGVRLADIPTTGTTIEPGHPVCTLLAEAASVDAACEKLAGIATTVHPGASSALDVPG